MALEHLLSPHQFGDLELRNRVAMAPCTRCKCPGFLPTEEVAAYYARRARDGVGLLISEGTVISERANGYPGAPGIWSAEQAEAWKPVTRAVHDAGGLIVCQLWHVGAVAHPLTTGGVLPDSPSGLSPEGRIARLRNEDGSDVHYGPSEAMSKERIEELISEYKNATARAMEAGFDGVEIHAAHGYLLDQFINLRWNQREDEWGGEGRCRLAGEVTRAVINECGAGRTLLRFSPMMSVAGEGWRKPTETLPLLLNTLWESGLRLLHASNMKYDEANMPGDEGGDPIPLHQATRALWRGDLVGVGSLTPERADRAIAEDEIDVAAFGRALIANPDFVSRAREGRELETYDPEQLEKLH